MERNSEINEIVQGKKFLAERKISNDDAEEQTVTRKNQPYFQIRPSHGIKWSKSAASLRDIQTIDSETSSV